MKHIIILILALTISLFGAYKVGDLVDDFTWQDSDGNASVSRTVSSLTNSNKVILFSWGYKGCQYCANEAPILDQIYKDPKYAGKVHFVWGSTNDDSWSSINGSGWRTFINPPITYMVSTQSQLGSKAADFGVNGVPHIAMVGYNRMLYAEHVGFDAASFKSKIEADLDRMISVYEGGVMEFNKLSSFRLFSGQSATRDISNVFYSKNQLSYSVQGVTPSEAVNAVINGNSLTVSAGNSGFYGTVEVVIKAETNGKSATSKLTVDLRDVNSPWLEWGVFYDRSLGAGSIGAPVAWQGAMDFNVGTDSFLVKRIEAGFTQNQTGMKWKIVTLDATGKPTQNQIGTLSGTLNTVAGSASGVEVSNPTKVTGKFAIVLEPNAGNRIYYDPNAPDAKLHNWVLNNGNWSILHNLLSAGFEKAFDIRVKLDKKAPLQPYGTSNIESDGSSAEKNMLTVSNYPNPFNPETSIKFSLSQNSRVQLTVYNAKGEMVAELLNSQLTAGSHSVKFNAGVNLQSGIFFCRLQTPEQTVTGKMMLIK